MANSAEGNMHKASGAPGASNGVTTTHGKVSPEEAERFAALFRPSWELSGELPGPVGEVVLSADQTLTDAPAIRTFDAVAANDATMQNGSYASEPRMPAARVDVHEPEDSVIIDRSITAADLDAARAPAPKPASHRPPPPHAVAAAPAFPDPIPLVRRNPPPAPVSSRPPPPRARAEAARKPPVPMMAAEEPISPPKSKMGLAITLGIAAAVVLSGIAIFVATSGDKAAEPAPKANTSAITPEKTTSPPKPASTAATTAAATTPRTTAAAATTTPPPPATPETATVGAAPAAVTADKTAAVPPPPRAAAPPRPAYVPPPVTAAAPPPPRPPPPAAKSEIVKKPSF